MLIKIIQKKSRRLFYPYLRSLVEEAQFFPRDIPFKKINTNLPYDEIKNEVAALKRHAKGSKHWGYTLGLKTGESRLYGRQTLPQKITFETEKDYLYFIGEQKTTLYFKENLALLREFPELLEWVSKNVVKIVECHGLWPSLLKVVRYFKEHPRPNLYLRELPIEVHTKFIEHHQGILKPLLDIVLGDENINKEESRFESRFSLKFDCGLIRFRLLDGKLHPSIKFSDISIPVDQACYIPQRPYVVLIENKMNFLAFPPMKDGMVIWSKGFNVASLEGVRWLEKANVIYWGDMDAQGFQILSLVRSMFPQTTSILMDHATYQRYESFVVQGTPSKVTGLKYLTEQEQELFQYLLKKNLRLEQEKIRQEDVLDVL